MESFERDGYFSAGAVLTAPECDAMGGLAQGTAGTRRMLEHAWCGDLAVRLSSLIGTDIVAVQCTLFEKSPDRNWLVPIHQDLSIPVAARVDHPRLAGWSRKEGSWFVRAPLEVLSQMVAVRLHLDPCGADDGPLRVVAGSHRRGILDDAQAVALRESVGETVCLAEKGAALVMRPLLLHPSSKGSGNSRRRVLHFVFGPRTLPFGLAWPATSGGTGPRNCG